jgi:hypothetical protein
MDSGPSSDAAYFRSLALVCFGFRDSLTVKSKKGEIQSLESNQHISSIDVADAMRKVVHKPNLRQDVAF